MPKFTRSAAELVTSLDRWLYFLRHAEQLEVDSLPATLDVPEIHRALGELQMLSQSDLERERYEGRLKQQRDARAALADARRQGIDEGRRRGIDEGRRQVWEDQIHFCEQLLRRPETPKEQLRGLPTEDLERLVKVLQAEVASRFS